MHVDGGVALRVGTYRHADGQVAFARNGGRAEAVPIEERLCRPFRMKLTSLSAIREGGSLKAVCRDDSRPAWQ
jgi:hypothetical protein